jgi:ribonuclease HI
MSFIQREQNRISTLLASGAHNKSAELSAALHALAWANDPTGFVRPSQFIMDIQEGREGCSDECRPPLSSDIGGPPR